MHRHTPESIAKMRMDENNIADQLAGKTLKDYAKNQKI